MKQEHSYIISDETGTQSAERENRAGYQVTN